MKMWLISLGFGFGKTRAVQCYVTLLVWIVIVSLGLYWFLNRSNTTTKDRFLWTLENYRWEANRRNSYNNYDDSDGGKESVEGFKSQTTWKIPKKSVEFSKSSLLSRKKTEALSDGSKSFLHSSVNRLCNPPEEIGVQDENLQVPEYKLDALVIIFRHGDRGPLSHVGSRNLSLVNCSSDHPEFQKFFRFTTDVLTKLGGYSQFIGPFHSFQKVPTSGQCHLGQLSQLGASQLLQLGKIIKSGYQSTLFNSTLTSSHNFMNAGVASSVSEAVTNNGSNNYHVSDMASHPLQNIKVVAYSTRYRRTLQSLMAFLYGLLGPKLMIPNVTVRESQSITFCFNDCSCRAADRLKKVASKKYRPAQFDKTAMINLINQINSIIDIKTKTKKSGATLLDLLLLYPCHKSDFPCREKSFMRKVHSGSTSDECVKMEDVSSLIALLQKENHSQKKIPANRQLSLLSSYGLLKEIVNLALKMTSSSSSSSGGGGSIKNSNIPYANNNNNAKTKVAIFSGHDTTLLCLTGALGIFTGHPDIHLVPYASRVIFEFYRKTNVPPNSARKHFFRIIYNGQAVTHLVRFCKESDTVVLVNSSKNNSKSYNTLCPLENLVRFLHDNYFETFGNATNFKDACQK